MPHDGGGDAGFKPGIRGGSIRRPLEKLRLADRPQLFGALFAVAIAAFDGDRGDDAVSATEVLAQFIQQINVGRALPEVMMRVTDRQVGFQGGFDACFTIVGFDCHSQHLQMQGGG